MTKLASICVYCGSNAGTRPEYAAAAKAMGKAIADRGLTLVYGGGKVGLMGILADACLTAGGRVVGIIPEFLALKEVAHPGLTEMVVVDSMHTRKAEMERRSDGFIALPGGIGTMEELFEVWTWSQLGQHRKPCGLLDVTGYYADLNAFLDRMATDGFVNPEHRGMLHVGEDPVSLLDAFAAYEAPPADIRIKVQQT
ncbi:TIGR00730 family Rossman fold protein [Hyphobacterium sp. HN65]|uniref:Cytokinin riboside 5'-monophosphate phosphoribohydrolase n=1 Tax=Hyphobacterium lacteum TaxID=3116575 RepID=A0ABU7LQB1_9PROT|nr:TIGR00730 family Rossman fold protein [Hyphobacterium sp. HN65]MEE2526083.1 TIGR00730 family Rossman fold protein [Hyphobacterium sp. HN65]